MHQWEVRVILLYFKSTSNRRNDVVSSSNNDISKAAKRSKRAEGSGVVENPDEEISLKLLNKIFNVSGARAHYRLSDPPEIL